MADTSFKEQTSKNVDTTFNFEQQVFAGQGWIEWNCLILEVEMMIRSMPLI